MTQTEAWIQLLANATKWLMLWQRTTELGLTTLNQARHCKTILIYCIWYYMDLYCIYQFIKHQPSAFDMYGSMNSMHILAMSCLTLQESSLSFKKAADLSAEDQPKVSTFKNIVSCSQDLGVTSPCTSTTRGPRWPALRFLAKSGAVAPSSRLLS